MNRQKHRGKFPKFKELKGQQVVKDEEGNTIRVEQLSVDGKVYHPTKGWRKTQRGFSTTGFWKFMALINKKVKV